MNIGQSETHVLSKVHRPRKPIPSRKGPRNTRMALVMSQNRKAPRKDPSLAPPTSPRPLAKGIPSLETLLRQEQNCFLLAENRNRGVLTQQIVCPNSSLIAWGWRSGKSTTLRFRSKSSGLSASSALCTAQFWGDAKTPQGTTFRGKESQGTGF